MRCLDALVLALLAPFACAQQDKLDDGIPDGDRSIAVFVRMTDQILKSGADYATYCATHKDIKRRAHRVEVIKLLKAKSDASWNAIKKRVDELGADVHSVERYWVVNGFACVAKGSACHALAKDPNVSFVYAQPRGVPPLHKTPTRNRPQLANRNKADAEKALAQIEAAAKIEFPPLDKLAPTWNVTRIKAPDAWQTGAFGQGITIALLDSGLLVTPALTRALRRNEKETLNGKDDVKPTDSDGDGLTSNPTPASASASSAASATVRCAAASSPAARSRSTASKWSRVSRRSHT